MKSGKLNNQLICEMIEHEEFPMFLVDTEIYIDRWMENYIRILDFVLLQIRDQFTENCGTVMKVFMKRSAINTILMTGECLRSRLKHPKHFSRVQRL